MEDSAPPEKRNRTEDLNYLIGYESHQIVSTKLPSNKEVISVFLYNLRTAKLGETESARLVALEIGIFWAKQEFPFRIRVKKIYDEWFNLRKGKYTHQAQSHLQKEKEFSDKLNVLFDVAKKDALLLVKGVIREFLQSQREKGRPGDFVGISEKVRQMAKKQNKKLVAMEARRRKSALVLKQQCKVNLIIFPSNFEYDKHQMYLILIFSCEWNVE